MKSSVLVILSILLATAILAPSLITLTGIGEKTAIAIDFNEEEKKEEKKEAKENFFFLGSHFNSLTEIQKGEGINPSFYFERDYTTSLVIFLPPPKYTL